MKQSYIIYYGTVNCDNHDDYPTHRITTCETEQEVEALYKEFRENIRDDDQNIYFRVFKGHELRLRAVETVTRYKLGEV